MKKRWIAIALLTVLLMGIGGAIGKVGVRQESGGSAYSLYFVERDLRSADGGDALRSEERTLEDGGLSTEELAAALVAELLKNAGYEVVRTDVVPDEQAQIEAALRQMADDGDIQLLVTTGGTGFAPRDVTPEATLAVCDRLTPGIPEAMRYASMQITSRAMLSRAQAGIRKGTLILNLPGSPKAAQENLEAVLPAISHGLEMLSGRPADCAKLTD